MSVQHDPHELFLNEIRRTNRVEDILSKGDGLPLLLKAFMDRGEGVESLNRFFTDVSEEILHKLIEIALKQMGPPPARFVFVLLGSACRNEQTLKTDQDNAIIFEDVPPGSEKEVGAYFLRLGEMVCDWLNDAGYNYCDGDLMAKIPEWCQPLSRWKGYFSRWINEVEPKLQLRFGTFFDFRSAYGDHALIEELRKHVLTSMEESKGFFRFLAEIAANYKAPLGLFGKFKVKTEGEHRNLFHIKDAMIPFVFITRLFAYKYGIETTNTLERLHQLVLKETLFEEEYRQIAHDYNFLMQKRFEVQVNAVINENSKPDNYVDPEKLSRDDRRELRKALKGFKTLQGRLGLLKAADTWRPQPIEMSFD